MTSKHLSDYDIQQFVLEEVNCHPSIRQHALRCPRCNVKAHTYRLIFASLKRQAKPVFEFDLTRLVLSNILVKEETKPLPKRLVYLSVMITMAPLAAVSYLFDEYLLDIFSNVSSISLYMVVTSALMFLAFQMIDMFKKHKKQMTNLDFGGTTATFALHAGHIKKQP